MGAFGLPPCGGNSAVLSLPAFLPLRRDLASPPLLPLLRLTRASGHRSRRQLGGHNRRGGQGHGGAARAPRALLPEPGGEVASAPLRAALPAPAPENQWGEAWEAAPEPVQCLQ